MKSIIFSLLFSLVFGFNSSAFERENNIVIADLSNKWLFAKENQVLPYLGEKNITEVFQYINIEKYKEYKLCFTAQPNLSLFIDHKLYYKNKSGKPVDFVVPLKDLNAREKQILLTLHDTNGNFAKSIYIRGEGVVDHVSEGLFLNKVRNIDNLKESALLISLLILMIIAFLKTRNPKRIREFFSLQSIFSVNYFEDNLSHKFRSFSFWGLLIINLFCFYLITLTLSANSSLKELFADWQFFPDTTLGFIKSSFFLLALILAKYLYLNITGTIFKIKNLVRTQYFEFIKLFTFANLLLVLFFLLLNISPVFSVKFSYIYFSYGFLFIMGFLLLKTAFLIFRYSSFRKLYLISYLCVSEVLPLIVIIKILVNNKTF